MISLNFVLLLCAAICFAVLVLHQVVQGARSRTVGLGWALPLGLLLWELPGLIAVWP